LRRLAYLQHLRETAAGRASASGDGLDLVEERAKLAAAQREKLEMANAVTRGELITTGEFHTLVTSAFSRVRSKLLALPAKAAPLVAGVTAPGKVQSILRVEIYAALNELASTKAAGVADDDDAA